MHQENFKFVFFGSSRLSEIVLEELEEAGFSPILKVTSARDPIPELPEVDLLVVASFGKILSKEILNNPKYGSLNVHPSLLPELRGPSPIQNLILQNKTPGVTIIKIDEKMDHGPILAQKKVRITPWPDHYRVVEEKLARSGGKLLVETLQGQTLSADSQGLTFTSIPQDDSRATYCKLVKKEDGLLDLDDAPETNLRKVLAYSTWPSAYFFFKTKTEKELRIVVKDAKIEGVKFIPTKIIPEGKREMNWQDFLRGNS